MNKQHSRIEPAQGELRIPVGLPADFVPTESGGLTAAQAARRAETGQANRQTRDSGKSTGQIVAENLFNLLNFALAICLALVGSWRNMLFLGVVFSNTLIGTVQSIRARQTLNKLRLLQTRNAHPIRDGQEVECPPEELVLGDLVVLRAGEQLPADAIVREGRCAADESLLTGESEPVVRQEGDWLMSGSFLTEGKVTAQLAAVGDDSYAARLMRSARVIRTPKSELMTELNRLVSLVSRILVPIGILLFCREYFLQHAPIQQAVPEAVAAMIGMIPEGLILLTSVALLAGVVKLGKRQTLVQELFGIESLARVDVLCVDKTGTLTTGEMTLDETIPMDADEAELNAAAARFLGAFEAASGTLRALADAIPAAENTALATLPFSSARKKSAASFSDGTTLILGAPSFVLDAVPARVTEASEQGYRVLALAEAEGAISGTELSPVRRCLGLFLLRDTLRPSVKDTLAWFSREGVSVRVLSGDDPRTVSAVARTLELPGADRIADCSLLSDDELRAAAADKVIFGRLTPARKQILVEALKAEGHSVAMTGDGVNDIPSLKAADCSIAIGGGAEATEHAAQIVLLDRDFNSLPAVVAEGRRVIGNITRTASLYLVKTLYSFVLGLIMVFLPLRYPFQPIHLTLISALSIGTPSFFLALEPSAERASGHFLKRILLRAVPGALAVVCFAIASMILSHCGTGHTVAATMAAVAAGWIGLANLALTCRPFTRLRIAVCIAMVIGYVGALAFLPKLFLLEIYAMTGTNWLQLAAITVGGLAVLLAGTKALTPAVRRLER